MSTILKWRNVSSQTTLGREAFPISIPIMTGAAD
jgi:hypothetical protein